VCVYTYSILLPYNKLNKKTNILTDRYKNRKTERKVIGNNKFRIL